MKKFLVCMCALFLSAGMYAQPAANAEKVNQKEAPKEIVTTTTEEVYEEITPEKEAEELTKMMSEATKITDAQKKEVYDVVLKALKDKVKLEPLRKDNKKEFDEKEMEIYQSMNEAINNVLTKE